MDNAKLKVLKKCQVDGVYFGKVISPDTFYLPSPRFHYKISSLLTDKTIKKGLVEAPRGTAKSVLSIRAAMHHYLFDNTELDSVIVIQSKTRREAIKRLWTIKNIIEYNRIYRDLFGYHGRDEANMWREDYIKFQYNGHWITIVAIGTGQQVRGILEDGTRVTFYLVDDPEDENNTATEEQMDKNYDVFMAGVATLDMRIGYVRVIGTPIVQNCLVDRIMTNPVGWTVQHYNARESDDGEGVLWKEMYSTEYLDELKADYESKHKLRNYYADYECTIKGQDEGFFKEEYLQYWDGKVEFIGSDAYLRITHEGETLDKLLELDIPIMKPVNIFLGIDPASSTSDRADFSVIMPIAYDSFRNIYILPYFHARVPSTTLADTLIEYIKRLTPCSTHVESTAYQTLLRETVRLRLMSENISAPGLEVPYKPIGKKEERLETLHHFFADKKVYFHPDTYDFVKELIMFGSKRGHDDTLDAFYYATRRLFTPDHIIETSTPAQLNEEEQMIQFRKLYGIKGKELATKSYMGIT